MVDRYGSLKTCRDTKLFRDSSYFFTVMLSAILLYSS